MWNLLKKTLKPTYTFFFECINSKGDNSYFKKCSKATPFTFSFICRKRKDLALYSTTWCHSTQQHFRNVPIIYSFAKQMHYPGRLPLFTLCLVWHLLDMGKWSWHNLDKGKVQTKQRHLLFPLPVVLGKRWLHISTKHSSWVAKSLASHSTREALGLYFFSQWAKTQHKNKENYDQMIRYVDVGADNIS